VDVRQRSLAATKIDGINDGIFGFLLSRETERDTVMALTDTRARTAKPSAKPYKLSDGGGMYLLVRPDGGRYWRLDYRFAGKRRTLALGVYPIVTLSEARARLQEARKLLVQNIDPATAKRAAKRAGKLASENTSF
jgi:hypothetical protein